MPFIFQGCGNQLSLRPNGLETSSAGHTIVKMLHVKMKRFPAPGSIQVGSRCSSQLPLMLLHSAALLKPACRQSSGILFKCSVRFSEPACGLGPGDIEMDISGPHSSNKDLGEEAD